jgi:Tol biopolymer transport system component/tRNA A-37 threonylcarbamoyl transferase component Bud32
MSSGREGPPDGAARWKQVLAIYEAASELPPQQRQQCIESRTADASIAAEVIELLRELDHKSEASLSGGADARAAAVRPGEVPLQVGRYEIEGLLGRGGMGVVYQARDPKLDRKVAIKVLNADSISTAAIERLSREARAVSALNHPNIVTVHEILETAVGLALVMEAVDGVALRSLAGRPMPVEQVGRIGRQVAEALSEAHRHGVIHRDIKPENIMVREDGYVKLLDFGMARRADSIDATREGIAPAGTLRYLSPEQAASGKVGPATDVFSLGIVLYELAAGRHPFPGASPYEAVHGILTADPEPLSRLEPPLAQLISSMLRKEAEARPSAAAVANSLQAVVPGMVAREHPAAERWRWAVPAIVGAALLTAAMMWWAPSSGTGRTQTQFRMLTPVPLAVDSLSEYEPRLSPDGNHVAYTRGSNSGGGMEVVVQEIGKPSSTARVLLRDAYSAVWSPQGGTLAMLRTTQSSAGTVDIVLVDAAGGEIVRKLGEIRVPGPMQDWVPSPYLDFSPDGRFLVACDGWGRGPSFLNLLSLETGESRPLTVPVDGSIGDFSPRFSPDGKRIAFAKVRRMAASDLYVLPLTASELRTAGPPVRIRSQEMWNAFPAWTPDGSHVVFASGQMHGARLHKVQASGEGAPIPLPVAEGSVSPIDLRQGSKPDTSRIVYSRLIRDDNIIRLELPARAGQRPVRSTLIDSSFVNEQPEYSADGRQVAFLSNRTGSFQVWIANADGTSPRQVSHFRSAEIQRVAWHPSGAFLAVQAAQPDREGLYEMDAASGELRLLVEGSAEGPCYSSDGAALLYGMRKDGRPRIWSIPARGGGRPTELVTGTAAHVVRQTPNGTALVLIEGLQVLLQKTAGGPSTPLFSRVYSHESLAVTNSAVYAVTSSSQRGHWELVAYHLATGKVKTLLQFNKDLGNGLSVAGDDSAALFTEREHLVLDLMLLEDVPNGMLQDR